jgi:membrane associated rhomboid family serine protease
MLRVTDVVKNLLIINVALFVVVGLIMPHLLEWFVLYYPDSDYFKPVQFVTHMFMHANMAHLFFNMFALYMFGTALEMVWGAKKFLTFYFVSGFGAIALHMFVWTMELKSLSPGMYDMAMQNPNMGVLGASGAVFGLLAGFGMKFPNQRIMLLFPPIPMKAKYFVGIYALIELYLGLSGSNTGIAHFAHLGGALFGALLVLYWKKRR